MITYEPMAGTEINRACKAAADLAAQHNDTAEFDFNGVRVVVSPNEDPSAAAERWWTEFNANADACRNSPEGQAAAADAERRRQRCQRDTDALIARLPNVLGDLPALIRWCAALSDCGDHVGITWEKFAVADQFEAAGWKNGAHVGRPPEEFEKDKRMTGEWLVGQAISCLRHGMAPHSVMQSFAERYEEMK